MCTCVSTNLSVKLPTNISRSVGLSVFLSVRSSIDLFVRPSICRPSVCLSARPSACPPVRLLAGQPVTNQSAKHPTDQSANQLANGLARRPAGPPASQVIDQSSWLYFSIFINHSFSLSRNQSMSETVGLPISKQDGWLINRGACLHLSLNVGKRHQFYLLISRSFPQITSKYFFYSNKLTVIKRIYRKVSKV